LSLHGCRRDPAFVSEEGDFEVAFPERPRAVDTPVNGPGTLHEHRLQHGRFYYYTAYHDVPVGAPPEVLLDAFGRRLSSATILSEESSEVSGYPERRLRLKTKTGAIMTARVIVHTQRHRMYQVGVTCNPEDADAHEVKAFIDSFRFRPGLQ